MVHHRGNMLTANSRVVKLQIYIKAKCSTVSICQQFLKPKNLYIVKKSAFVPSIQQGRSIPQWRGDTLLHFDMGTSLHTEGHASQVDTGLHSWTPKRKEVIRNTKHPFNLPNSWSTFPFYLQFTVVPYHFEIWKLSLENINILYTLYNIRKLLC